jgi:polysaccharide export outer membrane protein
MSLLWRPNAGDITITGDRKAVTIIRKSPTQMHDLDLTDINVMNSPYFYLQPNDYIYIKPLKQKTWGTGKTGIESLGTTFIVVIGNNDLLPVI